jgi:RNA polymerase sigma-70 factor, ECF subfamily
VSGEPVDLQGDESLIERSRAGDAGALERLFDRHRPALEARIRRHLPPAVRRRVSVADVVQETRILAFQRTDGFEPRRDGAYRAWLLRIAELKAREALRAHAGTSKRAVGREEAKDLHRESSAAAAAGPSPSEAAMGAERRDDVLRALGTLSPDHREVIRLARFEGHPIAEVAARMGRSTDAVKRLYGRALARLAHALGSSDGRAP